MRENKGVTMIILVITVVIMSILAGISMKIGTDLIKKAKLENLKTDMMLVQAKAKEYVEQASFKAGKDNEITDEVKAELIGTEIVDISTINAIMVEQSSIQNGLFYKLEPEHLDAMGLSKLETDEKDYYILVYDIKNIKTDVINTRGFVSIDGNVYYTLSQLINVEE